MAWPPGGSLTARRADRLEARFLEEGPSIALSAFYRGLAPAKRRALAAGLRAAVLARVPARVDERALPPAARPLARDLAELSRATTPEELERWIAAHDLDRFAPLPAAVLARYQDAVLDQPVPGGSGTRRALLDADLADPARWERARAGTSGYLPTDALPPEVQLLSAGDPVPASEVPPPVRTVPALDGDAQVVTRCVDYPANVLASSARLARGLNLLMRPQPVTLGRRVAHTPEELLAALEEAGYELVVYDVRMIVNFLDYSVRGVPVRIPTWAVPAVEARPGEPLVMPVFHSEYLLALYRPGALDPGALVRWFLAVPDGQAQGTLFRAAWERRRGWSGFRVLRAEEGRAPAERLLAVAGRMMRAFNFLQQRYAFPMGAYGNLGVCNDTTGILEVALGHPATAWPLVRDVRFDAMLGADVPEVARTPADTRPDRYPEVESREQVLYRIGVNLPVHDLSRLQFDAVAALVRELAGSSPALARGLAERVAR